MSNDNYDYDDYNDDVKYYTDDDDSDENDKN